MMKLRSGNLVILGLSDRNVELLKQGKPILFDGADVGLAGINIGIIHGKTEMEMERELIEHGYIIPQ